MRGAEFTIYNVYLRKWHGNVKTGVWHRCVWWLGCFVEVCGLDEINECGKGWRAMALNLLADFTGEWW